MRIAFVTGRLEPGRDGVGDYTRTLALECARRGHAVCLLSLAETAPVGDAGEAAAPTHRLTLAQWRGDRGRAARAWLDAFAPEWVSLQFVPYSFDPRGFFGASIAPLAHILGGARWRHVFFHEAWIGSQVGATLKSRLFGAWQRRSVRRLLRELAPAAVHTSTGYYRAALTTLRQPASLLSMFGAVPRTASERDALPIPGLPSNAIVCGHFGTLHPGWSADAFLGDFAALATTAGRPAALVTAGSLGYGAGLFKALAEGWRGRVHFVELGRLEPGALSRAFARFDFAVTSVPWNILGKSSSAAALREHGLCVVATEAGAPPRFAAPIADDAASGDAGFVPYFRNRALLSGALTKTPPRPGAGAIAERFLSDLNAAR